MNDDEIIEDLRKAGQEYVNSFNGDWKALIEDLRRRSASEHRKVVPAPASTNVHLKSPQNR